MFGGRMKAALAAGVVVLAVAACDARGPVATEALALSRPVAADQSRIIFYTPDDPGAWMVSDTNVFVNRRKVGRMLRNGVFWADVAPGRQIIATSAELGQATVIATEPGEVVFVELSSGMGAVVQSVTPRQVSEEEGRAALAEKRLTGNSF